MLPRKPFPYVVIYEDPNTNETKSIYHILSETENLQPDAANDLVAMIHGCEHTELPKVELVTGNALLINTLVEGHPIRAILERPDGSYAYYRTAGRTVDVAVTKTCGHSPMATCIAEVPACVAENDANGEKLHNLFRQIVIEFAQETTPVTHLTPQLYADARKRIWPNAKNNEMPDIDNTRWDDFFLIPEHFMMRYSVSIRHIEAQLSAEIDTDGLMFSQQDCYDYASMVEANDENDVKGGDK